MDQKTCQKEDLYPKVKFNLKWYYLASSSLLTFFLIDFDIFLMNKKCLSQKINNVNYST